MPKSLGIECPYTSASRTPTLKPRLLSAAARFTVTDDFPTPPLPDEIAQTLVKESGWANGMNFSRPPRSSFFTLSLWASFITPNSSSTFSTPATLVTAPLTSLFNLSRIGHPEIVSNILIFASPLSKSTLSTIPRSGRGL